MEEEKGVVTTDFMAIILLKAKGFIETKIEEEVKENGAPQHTYHFSEEAIPLYNDYISGREILVDFHAVEHFINLFKKRLYGRK